MKSMKNSNQNQEGSALFLILIAVMLFAALGYTVTNMMRSGSPDKIGEEKARLDAGQVLDFARQVRRATQELRISNGCSENEISFTRTTGDDYEHSPASRDECKIFHINGGAITYTTPLAEWLNPLSPTPTLQGSWFFPANLCVEDIGNGGSGCGSDATDNEDLVMVLPYITQTLCQEINKQLGRGSTIPVESGDGWPSGDDPFVGSFNNDAELNQAGLQQGCFEGSGSNTPPSGTYHFFQVLIPR